MGRELLCACGKTVKVGDYGLKAKKNKKNIVFSSAYDDTKYQCSKCRGIDIPKKKGVPRVNQTSRYAAPKGKGSSGADTKSKGDGGSSESGGQKAV